MSVSEARFETMTEAWMDAVLAIEQQAYTHPWSRGNFLDSIRSGYQAQVLVGDDRLIGYFVAMKGVDEVHLLNITVAPAFQRQGWSRVMLDALRQLSLAHDAFVDQRGGGPSGGCAGYAAQVGGADRQRTGVICHPPMLRKMSFKQRLKSCEQLRFGQTAVVIGN